MTWPHRGRAWLALLPLAMTAVACGSSSGDQAEGGGEKPVTITLLTHDSFAVSDDVLDAFTEATGIEVKLLQGGDAGTVVNQAILTRGAPQADVLFGVDSTFVSRALREDLFLAYEAAGSENIPADLVLDPKHRVTSIDYGDVCVNYDRAYFVEAGLPVPSTFGDLVDPRYQDLLVVENPATSSPGLAFLFATIDEFGEEGWQAYWEALADNGVEVTSGWEQAYYGSFSGGGTSEGTRPLVVSYGSSPTAEVVFADPPVDVAPTGVLASTCYRQVEGAGILAGTKHYDEAGAFLDFLLSRPFQEDVPLSMFVVPVNPAAVLPAVFVANRIEPAKGRKLPAADIDAKREEWIEAWTNIMLR
ncbi:MAG: thiamine ABC transporter substrate-binding protein [Acidimicrobiia bacterium]|nr:thiamine ABC transporter substrate-binding protein [Acidimicrobiia bacterium]